MKQFLDWLFNAGLAYLLGSAFAALLMVASFFSYWWHMELRYKWKWSDPRLKKETKPKFQTLFLIILFLATPATAKPKHNISEYNHVGVLFVYGTGVSQHGPNTLHIGDYTCYVSDNLEYAPDCSQDRAILEFRTDDGHEHVVIPTDSNPNKQFDKDILLGIYLNPKYFKAMSESGVPFRYRIEGNLIYVPIGSVGKHGHVRSEKSYLL